jgi:hypothetical protein
MDVFALLCSQWEQQCRELLQQRQAIDDTIASLNDLIATHGGHMVELPPGQAPTSLADDAPDVAEDFSAITEPYEPGQPEQEAAGGDEETTMHRYQLEANPPITNSSMATSPVASLPVASSSVAGLPVASLSVASSSVASSPSYDPDDSWADKILYALGTARGMKAPQPVTGIAAIIAEADASLDLNRVIKAVTMEASKMGLNGKLGIRKKGNKNFYFVARQAEGEQPMLGL